jgi:LPXTG-motif cell wall-anchored protein
MNGTATTARRRLGPLVLAMLVLAMLVQATAAGTAGAAPYSTTVSVTIAFSTNAQGQQTVPITITNGVPHRSYEIIIHSTPRSLGTITTDGNGNGSATFIVPAGFTGSHSVEVRDAVTGHSTSTAVALTHVDTGAPASTSGKASGDGLPNTGAAALGVGALVLVLLAAGAALYLTGRRRSRTPDLS